MLRFIGIGLVACAIVLALMVAWMVIRLFVHLLVAYVVDGRLLSPRGRGVLRNLVAQLIYLVILLAFIGFAAAHGPGAALALALTSAYRFGTGLFALRLIQDVVNRRRAVGNFSMQPQQRAEGVFVSGFDTIFGFLLAPWLLILVALIPVPRVRLVAFLCWSAVVAASMFVVMRKSGDGRNILADADQSTSQRPYASPGNNLLTAIPKRLDAGIVAMSLVGLAAVVIYTPLPAF